MNYYVTEVYDDFYKRDHKLEETKLSYDPCLSSIPYSKTDRGSMPDWYLCMGSLPVHFQSPSGSISTFAFVDFRHTHPKAMHNNSWLYWRNPDGSTEKCYTKDIPGHDKLSIGEDIAVNLIMGEDKVFTGIIPGKKEEKDN